MTTYVHVTKHDARSRYRPTSWHIIDQWNGRAFQSFCGRLFAESADTMQETPNAATCERCYQLESKTRDNLAATDPEVYADGPREDDPEVAQEDPVA